MKKFSNSDAAHRLLALIKSNSQEASKTSASKSRPGLWANIRAKKKRGEKPAQPGDEDYPDAENWSKLTKNSSVAYLLNKMATEAWQRAEGQSPSGGLNAKGRASYNRATGGDLKAPVTQKNPKGKAKARRKSFCSRMSGMKRKLTSKETANDPDSRINKALRKWRCKSSSLDAGVSHTAKLKRQHVGLNEQVLVQPEFHGLPPDEATERNIYEILRAAYPTALENTKVYSGEYDPNETYTRAWNNPRISVASRLVNAVLRFPSRFQGSARYESMGPFYDPAADAVFVPWNAPAATMHELGHAADFNSVFGPKVPKNMLAREAKALARDAYGMLYKFNPLWHEHTAWRKGRQGLLQGAAKLNKDFEKDLAPVLTSEARSKRPALGSYWGGTMGLLGSMGLAASSPEWLNKLPTRAKLLIYGGLPVLGALGGMGLGALLRPDVEKYLDKHSKKYQELLSKRKIDSDEKTSDKNNKQ